MLLALLATAAISAPAEATLVTPWLQPPSNWMMVYIWAPDHDAELLTPVLRWEHVETGQVQEKILTVVKPGGPKLRVVQGPELEGPWRVTVRLQHEKADVAESGADTVRVIPLWAFFLILCAVFGGLITGSVIAIRRGKRARLIFLGALVVTAWLWVPMIMAGYTLFGLLAGLLTALAIRHRDVPSKFLMLGSLAVVIFSEIYWGAIVNGTFWTAPVISLTILWLLWRGLGLIFRGDRKLAWATWVASVLLIALYVTLNIYKAFFLDYPSIAVSGDAGQIGQILDSISHVFRVTHLMGGLLPLGVLAGYWALKRRLG